MDELHAADHSYIPNFAVFSVRLNSQRYDILEAQDCTDPTASLDLQWKVFLFLHSTYHYWSLKTQAIQIGSYPSQRAVYLMPMINIDPYWMVKGHPLADDDLKKIVAAKMIGMPLPVDCLRPGIWWWDAWCSSRCHCNGWVCRHWCQCCEWAWQY